MTRDRGQVQFVDALLGVFVLVALILLFPIFDSFAQSIAANAGPFTSLVLRLVYPSFIIALVLSIGVSARRGGSPG